MFHVEQTTEDSAIEYESAASTLERNCFVSLFVTPSRLDMQELYNWQWVQAQVAQSIDILESKRSPAAVGWNTLLGHGAAEAGESIRRSTWSC